MTNFAVGQRWTYEGLPQSVPSTVLIGAIEGEGDTMVIHVVVENIESPAADEPITVGHMPFTAAAIGESVIDLVEQDVAIDERFNEGIAYWREQAGGVFTIPVSEAVGAIMEASASQAVADPGLGDAFDEMLREFREKQAPEMLDDFYREVLSLPQWFFICAPHEPQAPVQWAFPDGHNPEPAVLAFTSRNRALLAANELGLYPAGTDVPLMAPSVADAVQWIASDGFANGWLCFNLTQENFPFYADEVVGRYRDLQR